MFLYFSHSRSIPWLTKDDFHDLSERFIEQEYCYPKQFGKSTIEQKALGERSYEFSPNLTKII